MVRTIGNVPFSWLGSLHEGGQLNQLPLSATLCDHSWHAAPGAACWKGSRTAHPADIAGRHGDGDGICSDQPPPPSRQRCIDQSEALAGFICSGRWRGGLANERSLWSLRSVGSLGDRPASRKAMVDRRGCRSAGGVRAQAWHQADRWRQLLSERSEPAPRKCWRLGADAIGRLRRSRAASRIQGCGRGLSLVQNSESRAGLTGRCVGSGSLSDRRLPYSWWLLVRPASASVLLYASAPGTPVALASFSARTQLCGECSAHGSPVSAVHQSQQWRRGDRDGSRQTGPTGMTERVQQSQDATRRRIVVAENVERRRLTRLCVDCTSRS